MYAYIKGILTSLTNEYAVLEASGIGYKLYISLNTCSRLSKYMQKEAILHTHLNVKEDILDLFGFYNEEELSLFKHLVSVSGIGPKAAMSILSTLTTESFALALANNDARMISQAPGVGLKTAQKVIIELKDKIAKEFGETELKVTSTSVPSSSLAAVVDTLSVYGFSRSQIIQAMTNVDTKQPIEEIIRQTLKVLGSN
ncbi:MAG: Holliday junction DNA helicase RuvA [Clostridiales bacterium GWF2_36_10]|nr:MAG: Holliday junction DNA helicase RuvA [Clostridiales bacterium GWF2_36_10]HAN21451.1 Holliday junction branch migration protein RuvA [Clostridiales bacterium]